MQASAAIYELINNEKYEESAKVGLEALDAEKSEIEQDQLFSDAIHASKDPIFWNNLGVAFQRLRLYDLALFAYQKAINLKPDFWLCYLCQGLVSLLSGKDYKFGFERYEYRLFYYSYSISIPSDQTFTLWKGEDLSLKTLLIHREQGLGDTIHFLRYVPYIQARYNCNIILFLQRELNCLFKHLNLPFVNEGDHCSYDFCVFPMSLPLCFKTELCTIPPPVKIDCCLNPVHKKIGIMWKTQYNNNDPQDLRSIQSVTQLEAILKIPGFRFVCLQKIVSEEDAEFLDSYGVERPAIESFLDTVKILETCERVITIDTAVAHLSASMGVPTWIILNYTCCWRWLNDRADSVWYPAARLFRQKKQHIWTDPIQEIASELKDY